MNRKRSRTVHPALLLAMAVVLLLVLTPSTVAAIDRRTGEQVVIDTGETITDDLNRHCHNCNDQWSCDR